MIEEPTLRGKKLIEDYSISLKILVDWMSNGLQAYDSTESKKIYNTDIPDDVEAQKALIPSIDERRHAQHMEGINDMRRDRGQDFNADDSGHPEGYLGVSFTIPESETALKEMEKTFGEFLFIESEVAVFAEKHININVVQTGVNTESKFIGWGDLLQRWRVRQFEPLGYLNKGLTPYSEKTGLIMSLPKKFHRGDLVDRYLSTLDAVSKKYPHKIKHPVNKYRDELISIMKKDPAFKSWDFFTNEGATDTDLSDLIIHLRESVFRIEDVVRIENKFGIQKSKPYKPKTVTTAPGPFTELGSGTFSPPVNRIRTKKPDYSYWLKNPSWELGEGIFLLFDIDPEGLGTKLLEESYYNCKTSDEMRRTFKLAKRSLLVGELKTTTPQTAVSHTHVEPKHFMTWAESKDLSIPKEFESLIQKEDMQVQNMEPMNLLNPPLDRTGEGFNCVEDEPLNGKERQELGRLRREKDTWDKSIAATVHATLFTVKNPPVKRADFLQEIEQAFELPETTIQKIWKAIPSDYRKGSGRPKKK